MVPGEDRHDHQNYHLGDFTNRSTPTERRCTPRLFERYLKERVYRIEALLIYLAGVEVEGAPCRFCQSDYGPFPLCIISAADGVPSVCANCHWLQNRCTATYTNHRTLADMGWEQVIEGNELQELEEALQALEMQARDLATS
ncbi:unnamed protein product [Penicillium bialowiezense]